MSCPCPSGYTPTINSDDCIYTVTAATSGGTFFYTGVAAYNTSVYCQYGVFFYEDITNLSYPITSSGTTGTTTTENGTPLFSTEFIVDNSGRILNIQAGGRGAPYGPTTIQNSLWGFNNPSSGRLNNAGLWTTSTPDVPPYDEWIGFSYCLDIPTTDTYFIGIASDNLFKLTINNQVLIETSYFPPVTLAMGFAAISFSTWSVFPITLNSGLNIIQMESLNLTGPLGNYAAFAAEIYSGSVATLSGYTSYSQLSADTIFSTLNFIGQDIPLSSSGATTGTGYTCPSGYTLYNCSGTPYCIQIDRQPIVNYCVNDTGLGYDDFFKYAGTHNSEPYWSGETNGYVIFYSTGGTWCLSTVLDGDCLLDGPYPCNSVCPDLCDTYVFSGSSCPTPTPTPSINPCDTFDFTAIFDCEVTPTPSVTPTISVTPTNTPTPSTSPLCPFIGVSVTITGITPTVTPTMTPTPSNSPQVTRPCSVSGNVTFNSVIGIIDCPSSKKFVDCSNGSFYYASNPIVLPSGGTLSQLQTFKADVDGISTCVVFVGIELDVNGFNVVELTDGPYNSIGDCSSCVPNVTQTPTVTPTPSITPTNTPTPTPSVAIGFYLYRRCAVPTQYLIQTLPGPSVTIGQIFANPTSVYFNDCWEYVSYSATYPSLPLGTTSSFISGNGFTNSGTTFYNSCIDCQLETGDVA